MIGIQVNEWVEIYAQNKDDGSQDYLFEDGVKYLFEDGVQFEFNS
jgi:hypothetical protein